MKYFFSILISLVIVPLHSLHADDYKCKVDLDTLTAYDYGNTRLMFTKDGQAQLYCNGMRIADCSSGFNGLDKILVLDRAGNIITDQRSGFPYTCLPVIEETIG